MGFLLDEVLTVVYVIAIFLLAKSTVSITNKLLTGASIAGDLICTGAKAIMGAALAATGVGGAVVGAAGGAAGLGGMLTKTGLANTAFGKSLKAGSNTGEMVFAALANAKPAAEEKLPSLPAGFGVGSAIGNAQPVEERSEGPKLSEQNESVGTTSSSVSSASSHGTSNAQMGTARKQSVDAKSRELSVGNAVDATHGAASTTNLSKSSRNDTSHRESNAASLKSESSHRDASATAGNSSGSALAGLTPQLSTLAQALRENSNAITSADDTQVTTWASERGFKPDLTSSRLTPEGIAVQSRDYLKGVQTNRTLSSGELAGKSEAFISGYNTVFPPPVSSEDGVVIQQAKSHGWIPSRETEQQGEQAIAQKAHEYMSGRTVRQTAVFRGWKRPADTDDESATLHAREFLRSGPVSYDARDVIEKVQPADANKWAQDRGWAPDPRNAGQSDEIKAESSRDYLRGLYSSQPMTAAQLATTSQAFQSGHNRVFPPPVQSDDTQVIQAARTRGWTAGESTSVRGETELAQDARRYISNQAVLANAQAQNWTPNPHVDVETNVDSAREHLRTGGMDVGSRITVMAAAERSRAAIPSVKVVSGGNPTAPALRSPGTSASVSEVSSAMNVVLPSFDLESGPPPSSRQGVGTSLHAITGSKSNTSGTTATIPRFSSEARKSLKELSELSAKAAAEANATRIRESRPQASS